LGAHPLATKNIDMAVQPEEGGELAHGRIQSALPVRTTEQPWLAPNGHSPFTGGTPKLAPRGAWLRQKSC
jgi:hypothetical protein